MGKRGVGLGPLNGNWKGGRSIASNGYVLIRVGKDHHLADVRGYAYEHRLIAEQKLGRRLRPGEIAHHDRDHDRTNNAPDNIEVKASIAHHLFEHRKLNRGRQKPDEENSMKECECGYRNGGATSAAFARLTSEGWAVSVLHMDGSDGLRRTQAGLDKLGAYDPLPVGDELRRSLLSGDRLPIMECKLLAVICDAYPAPMPRGEIIDQAGYKNGGATSKALAHLTALDYVNKSGRGLVAAPELFG